MLSFIRNLVRPRPTWDALLEEYLLSAQFRSRASSTRWRYEKLLRQWLEVEQLGSQPAADLTKRELEAMLARRKQGMANFLLKRVRVLIRFGVKREYLPVDITAGVDCKPIGREHHTWTDGEIAQYRAYWKLGTRQRLAFELALCTSQRRGDLTRMRWEHIIDGRLAVTQHKTKVSLSLPIHPDLQAAISAMRGGTSVGPVLGRAGRKAQHMTPESLTWLFARWCEDAGLPDACVLHGLRKACCRRLAEMGCSEKEIASVSGHKTLGEVARYTRAASQGKLADRALARIVGA